MSRETAARSIRPRPPTSAAAGGEIPIRKHQFGYVSGTGHLLCYIASLSRSPLVMCMGNGFAVELRSFHLPFSR